MKADEAAAPTAWTRQRERSNRFLLLVMRRLALALGRRTARVLLHPIACWFVLDRATRMHSARYLSRALARPATWGDVYRHVHAFASTVLDRVYLLRERFDEFRFAASGVDAILVPFARGDGVLAFGAHLGSFEALRMIGHDKGLRIAMIMYEDNARLINETLAALAPKAELRTIALGRVDAMLSLRRWLDDGGVAGLLADRTLAAGSQRSRLVSIPFLGTPALFADGPFRLAAILKRRVVFMAGLYRGGRDYELRFVDLADFGTIDFTGPAGAAARDAAVRAALERYVATLEALCRDAPYNWFNFYDFWADADATPAADAAS